MHRRWSADDVAKLKIMAQRFPASQIAAELGRGLSATMVKAHELRLSLRMKRDREGKSPSLDPGAAGLDLPTD
jgi:hypothetical protein